MEELTIQSLIRHDISEEEARGFVLDHGAARALVWLRTCPVCKGQNPDECPRVFS